MKRITQGLMILMAFVAISLSTSVAMAGDLKIGIVDLHQVLQESSQAKVISQQLEKQFKPRQEKLFTAQKQLKSDADKFRRDATIMTATQKKQLQDKITTEQRDLEQSGTKYQQELNKAQNQAMQSFFNKVKVALDKVAKQGGYDLILQKESVPYSAPQMDVTKQVIANIA